MLEYLVGTIALIIILFFLWFIGYVTDLVIQHKNIHSIRDTIFIGIITLLGLVLGSMLLLIAIGLIKELGIRIMGLM